MNIRRPAEELVFDLVWRSPCGHYKMAAVLLDNKGRIFAWGWNHPSKDKQEYPTDSAKGRRGFKKKKLTVHAEEHALTRGNKTRIKGATIVIGGLTGRGNPVMSSRPCEICFDRLISLGVKNILFHDSNLKWYKLVVSQI